MSESTETVAESFFMIFGFSTAFIGFRFMGISCATLLVLINTVKLRAKSIFRLFVRKPFNGIFVKEWLGF